MDTNGVRTNLMTLSVLTLLAIGLLAGQARAQGSPALSSDRDRLSYALGMDLGNQLRTLAIDVDPTLFGKALGDALSGGKTLMRPEEASAQIAALQAEMRRRRAKTDDVSSDNRNGAATIRAAQPAAGAMKRGVVHPH